MQNKWTTNRLLHGEDRSEARMSSVLFLLAIDWIRKKTTQKKKKWDPVDTLEPVGEPGLCV